MGTPGRQVGVPAVPYGARVQQLSREGDDIPEKAVLLSEDTVMDLQWKMISKWQPRGEMWPFRQGIGMLAGCAILSGSLYNMHFRRKMHLGVHGQFITYATATLIPAALSALCHFTFVGKDIMLRKTKCASCLQVRGACVQALTGCLQPYLLSLLACSALAKSNATYALPKVHDPRGLMKTYSRLSQPLAFTVTCLLAVNLISVTVVTNSQMKASLKLYDKLATGDIDRYR